MYHTLLVAFDGSPDSRRALGTGICLSKHLGAKLFAVIVEEDLPAFATSGGMPEAPLTPEVIEVIEDQRTAYYANLKEDALKLAEAEGVTLHAEVIQGGEVEGIVEYAKRIHSDLLLIGYRRHTMMRDRFLGSTAHALAITSPCSLLAVKDDAGCSDAAPTASPTPVA